MTVRFLIYKNMLPKHLKNYQVFKLFNVPFMKIYSCSKVYLPEVIVTKCYGNYYFNLKLQLVCSQCGQSLYWC